MVDNIRSGRFRSVAAAIVGLGIALTLTGVPGTGTATAAVPTASAVEASAVDQVRNHVTLADRAISRALRRFDAHQYSRARAELATGRLHVKKANALAAALIGAPPEDPESDELPGPPAVVAALRLDNRVTMRVAPLFNGMRRARVLDALRYSIVVAQTRREALLDQVFALPRAGGDDYADGMADTLPIYSREVASISQGIETFSLSASGRAALTTALGRSREAKAAMNAAYGGGERAPA